MTSLLEGPPLQASVADLASDRPRSIDPGTAPSDKWFRGIARGIGLSVLAITGMVGLFLGWQAYPTFKKYGFGFLTTTTWVPEQGRLGIAAVLVGTLEVAATAMVIAFPLALAMALFITEYAPPRFRGLLVSTVDLMAAVPSIIYGLAVRDFLQKHVKWVAHWLNTYLGWIPLFKVDTDPHAAPLQITRYTASVFVAAVAVSMMVLPMACAVMREVFSQAPVGEREAALALGSTRVGVIRTVVLPFGRGGVIGGSMLALGRALGETIAVVLIVSPAFRISPHLLEIGTNTVSALIAGRFNESTGVQLSALLCAGFILFLITLVINSFAAVVISRSRSGADVDA